MPTRATYTIFPGLRSNSNKHDPNHKSLIDSPRQRHLTNSLHDKHSDIASTKLQGLRLFAFPISTLDSQDNKTLPSQPSPDTLISPMTLSTPTFSSAPAKSTLSLTLATTKHRPTILDVSTLNETSTTTTSAARYKETAIIPRRRRPILPLFSRQHNGITKRAARLFSDFEFPAHGDDDKENAIIYSCDDSMVSPKTVEIATFGYGRIVNVGGRGGKVMMEGREQVEVGGLWSAGSKRSWE